LADALIDVENSLLKMIKLIEFNQLVFETIYHASMETSSMELAKKEGPILIFQRFSTLSKGILLI
jgi:Holliday junction resolvasome RuvABC endonuclease subunit